MGISHDRGCGKKLQILIQFQDGPSLVALVAVDLGNIQLTTTIDSLIADDDKLHPAKWLTQLSQHYLGGEPIIQSTHNLLRILKQDPGMTIQAWYTLARLEYQKCQFPAAVNDRLQRNIFLIGLNDIFKRFRVDVISSENFTLLTFAQVISKARDFADGLKTESAIIQYHLEEAANRVTPSTAKSTRSRQPFRRPGPPASPTGSAGPATCPWCARTPHSNRRDCPDANATCHGCGKRGHWYQVCKASSANVVSDADLLLTQSISCLYHHS